MFTKKTRIISLLVTISMLISMVAYFSISVTASNLGATPISSAAQFASMAMDGNYILTQDIDFSGVSHKPIGTLDAPFIGTFDGDGYTIKNLTLASDDNFQGLFGVNKGTIRNLKMDSSCSISGNAYVGAVAGKNYGMVENCISEATVSYTKSSTAAGSYKVLTQNLCQWGDSEFAIHDTYKNASTQLSRRPGMIARINEVSPDLIAFQENSFTDMNKVSEEASWWDKLIGKDTNTVIAWKTVLANNFNDTYTFFGSQGSKKSSPQEGATIAYKTARFNELSKGTFWHSTNPDASIDEQDANWDDWGFGAGNRRVCNWAALQDKASGQKIVLYSLHPQHDSEAVRMKEIPVLIEKMNALRATYPDAIFIAAGDYNASVGSGSYNLVENWLNGEMDNARNIATAYVDGSNAKNTSGNIYVGATSTIDHIMVDGSAANVTSYEIRDELYNTLGTKYAASEITTNKDSAYNGSGDTLITRETPLRPSDHNGVVATFEVRTNYAIGGVVGENDGTVRTTIAKGNAPASAVGVNNNAMTAVYGTGTVIGGGSTAGATALPAKASLEVVWKLNQAAGKDVFAIVSNDYALIGSGDSIETPIRVQVNGKSFYTMPNSGTFNLDITGIKDPVLLKDGKIIEGSSIQIGDQDIKVSVADSIMNVTEMASTGVVDFTIKNQDELEYADSKLSIFNKADITLYLLDDIDLTGTTFDGFGGKILFNFNGMDHTIKNWNTSAIAFFPGLTDYVNGYQGEYIKNVTFDNVHTKGAYGRSVVVANAAGNVDFLMENVHVKNSSTTITNAQNSAAILYTHNNTSLPKTVTFRNCSIIDTEIKKAAGITNRTNVAAVNGRIGNGVNYVIDGIFVKGFKDSSGDDNIAGTRGHGVLGGTKESGLAFVINNAVIIDCEINGLGYDLVGWQYDGAVKISNVFTKGNETGGLLSFDGGSQTFANTYTDHANFVNKSDAAKNDGVVVESFTEVEGVAAVGAATDAEFAYKLNIATAKGAMKWAIADGKFAIAKDGNQVRKVTVVAPDASEKVYYANGGSTLELAAIDGQYPYVAEGNGSINGISLLAEGDPVDSLVVSSDKDTIVRYIDENSPAYEVVQAVTYYEGMNLAYFSNANLAANLEEAKTKLANGTYANNPSTAAEMANALIPVYNTTLNAEGTNMPSIAERDTYSDAVNFVVRNVDEFIELASTYKTKLNDTKYTIHLACDLDFSDEKIKSFSGFLDAKFSFDGHNHTIKNWGIESAPVSSNGFFNLTYNTGAGGMNYLKNFTLLNCYAVGEGALVYGVRHANAGNANIPNVFTMENVHVKDSYFKAKSEGGGILMARYGKPSAAVTVNILNCSITGSTLDAAGAAHKGLVMGKLRCGNNGTPSAIHNLKNIYLADNEIINATVNAGIIFGCGEDGKTTVNIENVGVVNNSITATGEIGLAGSSASGKINLKDVFFQGNTTDCPNVYLVSGGYEATTTSTAAGSATNVFHDHGNLIKAYENNANILIGATRESAYANGTVAGEINAGTTEQTLYWTTNENGKIEPSALADSTHKADLMANGKVVKSVYANGGESVELSVAEDPAATFTKQSGSGTLSGKTLTMPKDGTVTKITVNTSTNAFDHLSYPAVSSVNAALTAGGNYTIYNEADWDHLETYVDYFNHADIVIHLAADMDLSKISFICFDDPYFSFDGHGHTVSGWGTEANPARSNGMFRYNANEGRMKYIKNLNIENCHTKYNEGATACTALLFTNECGDGGYSNAATNFTIDNIHIKDCSVIGIGNRNAVILSAYANSANAYTVTIKNCSIVNTDFTPGVHNTPSSAGHSGLLMGKVNNNTSKTATYNFSNIYLSGNTMNAGRSNYDSFMLGNIEGTYSGGPVYNVTINMNNIVATDNVVNSLEANIGLVGNNDRGIVNVDGMILLNNDYKSSVAITSTSLFASNIASESKLTVENVYTDEAVTANMQGASGCTIDTSPNAITSGEAAYGANAAATADSIYYWRTEEGKVVQSDIANSTHRADLVLANGTVLKSYYANGGEKVTIEVEEDSAATFSMEAGSSGSVSGRTLTMPTDGTVARVVVTPSDASIFAAYDYASVTTVGAAVTSGNYTVSNATEWKYVFDNLAYFNADGVTIHLIADIDLGSVTTFTGFNAATFNMDGHNHTVSNWRHSNTIGMFANYKGGTIKNMIVENCHVGGGYGRALFFGNGITGNVTAENIHVRNCSVAENSDGNLAGIFFGQYTAGNTGTIRNCSVIDTEIKTNMTSNIGITNSGIVCGRFGKSTETYVVENLFVDGFINNAHPDTASQGNGILFGTAEGGNAKATLTNVVMVNCGGTAASEIVGKQYNDRSIVIKNMLAFNNDTLALNCTAQATTATSGLTFTNVITDTENVMTNSADGAMIATKTGVTKQELEEVDMLTFAGTMNDTLTAANGYKSWTVNKDGLAVYATEANATRKVSYQVGGREIGKVYANGGSQITLGLANDPKATFALGANDAGTLDGKTLTLPTVGYMVVPITVGTEDSALATVYGYPSVTTVTEDAHRTGLNYTIANAAEWMHFFGQYNHFQSTDVTIHIIGEVDLAGKTAEEFYDASESALGSGIRYTSFMNSAFSLDGHGNAIKNWGDKALPMPTMGLYRYNGSAAGLNFIKNLVIDNWHTIGSGGHDTTFLVTLNGSDNSGRDNLSDNLVIENVHIKDSSLTCEGPRSGFFIANYVKADGDYSVTLKNCSLTNSTMNGTTNGHQGLLIGKASSFNGKKATYNLSNIYVAGNTMNAKRDAYVGLGIGNIEINGDAVAQMKVNMSNVVFEDNTLNSVSATPALFGHFVGTEVNADGVVFENNTVSSTVEMTGRTIFTTGATTQNVAGLYHDDANITKAFGNGNNAGVKYGKDYMTSGEAAVAANLAGEDSVFFYTTTEEGVELGTKANATRRVSYQFDGREVKKGEIANGGETVVLSALDADPNATFSGAGVDGMNYTIPADAPMIAPVAVTFAKSDLKTAAETYSAVTAISTAQTSGNYTIANAEEWMYVYNHKAFFDAQDVALHLIGEIDLSENVAKSFTGFKDFRASVDGHENTIKNFGSKASPITTLGIFYSVRVGYKYNGDGAGTSMNYLKNMKVDNCHVKAGTRGSAVFYGSYASNGGIQNGPVNFLVENIHLSNCSMKATAADDMALLVGRYNKDGGNASTLTIKSCSVIDSLLDLTGQTSGGHAGTMLGKGVGDNTNIFDCYLKGVEVTGANGYAGIVMGSVESGTHTINNVAVVDCSITAVAGKEASLLCPYSGGNLYARYNIFQGNTVNAEGGRYLTGAGGGNASASGSINDTNICDDADIAGAYNATKKVGTSKGNTGRYIKYATTAQFASGAPVYTNNGYSADLLVNRALFWTVDADGKVIPADGNQTRKVTFNITDGTNTITKAVGYTGYDKKVISLDISAGELAVYDWKRADSSDYTVESSFTGDETITAVGVITTALTNALKYWNGKEIAKYFNRSEEIINLIAALNKKLDENFYQKQENTVPGLGFEKLTGDITLLRSYEGDYQAPNADYSNVPTAAMIGTYADALHYTISSLEELKTAKTNELKYQKGSTLHLLKDIDLKGDTTFAGFTRPLFDFDGHNNTISNWTYNGGNTYGIAFISRGETCNIRNLTFDTVNITAGRHSAVVYGSHNNDNTDFGASAENPAHINGTLTIDNVHVKNAVVNSGDEQVAIILPNTQSGRSGYVINNCSIEDSSVVVPSGKGNVSGFVARLNGGTNVTITNCYIEGFDIPAGGGNVSLFCGKTESAGSNITINNVAAYDCTLRSTAEIYFCSARTTYTQAHNLKNIILYNIDAQSSSAAGRDNVFITYGNLDNVGFNTSNTDDETPVNIFMDQGTRDCLHTTYPAYHKHDTETPDKNIKMPTILPDEEFTNGIAAWKANDVLKADYWLVDSDFATADYPTMFASDGFGAPRKITLTENRTETPATTMHYTNGSGKVPAAAETIMGTNIWLDGESNSFTKDTAFKADKELTLESIIKVDIAWDAIEFNYNFGEWDEDRLQWSNGSWSLDDESDNDITLANNGTVFVTVALTYESTAEGAGITGAFTDAEDAPADTALIPLNADGAGKTFQFNISGEPEGEKVGTPTIGSLKLTIAGPSA